MSNIRSDKELADAVVAILGFEISDMFDKPLYDWRVAGSLMEKCWKTLSVREYLTVITVIGRFDYATSESLPRAIIEACVKALKGESQ